MRSIEELGPRLVVADGTQSVYLADMSGDGLMDLAGVRNGEVCYWPNLGRGRFGATVTMDAAPRFDSPERFDRQRICLLDIDGSGATDIVYLARDGARLYLNESGSRWALPRRLSSFPPIDNPRAEPHLHYDSAQREFRGFGVVEQWDTEAFAVAGTYDVVASVLTWLNLEAGVPPSTIPAGWWRWTRNYCVWEANRKVFLYPENWLGPELRSSKSQVFAQLDDELQPADMTKESAEKPMELDPSALVRLKFTGSCEVERPEALFDLEYPAHHMRRMGVVSLSVPFVAGPYTGANAGGGQPDEHFLLFEGLGAVSRWRVKLPVGLHEFDYDTTSDVIIHLVAPRRPVC